MSAIWLKHSSADAALVRQIGLWRSRQRAEGVVGSTARQAVGPKVPLGRHPGDRTSAGIYGKHRPMAQRPALFADQRPEFLR